MNDLVWTSESHDEDGEKYTAEYPWNRAFDHSGYYVYPWKSGWALYREEHPILGELSDRAKSLNAAKKICQADFEKQVRLRAWTEYMFSHDPPEG